MKITKDIITLKVRGCSMAPLINENSLLQVNFRYKKHYRQGEIVIFQRKGKIVAHRIIWTRNISKKYLLLLKGDFNIKFDGWINEKDIFGKVIRIKGLGFEINLETNKNIAFSRIFIAYSLINALGLKTNRLISNNSIPLKKLILNLIKDK